jgi:hypothetical protein
VSFARAFAAETATSRLPAPAADRSAATSAGPPASIVSADFAAVLLTSGSGSATSAASAAIARASSE